MTRNFWPIEGTLTAHFRKCQNPLGMPMVGPLEFTLTSALLGLFEQCLWTFDFNKGVCKYVFLLVYLQRKQKPLWSVSCYLRDLDPIVGCDTVKPVFYDPRIKQDTANNWLFWAKLGTFTCNERSFLHLHLQVLRRFSHHLKDFISHKRFLLIW